MSKRIQTTLEKLARLYDLIEEMRGIIKDLHEVDVQVGISNFNSWQDPVGEAASIMVRFRPGCDIERSK